MKIIKCRCGKDILLDDTDYVKVITAGHISCNGKTLQLGTGYNKYQLASFILDTPFSMQVDHRDRGFHNMQRNNLRLATVAQNCSNQGPRRTNKSGYKGVSLRSNGKWRAQICVNYKVIYIGEYPTPELAAAAYNHAARKYHGEFAYENQLS